MYSTIEIPITAIPTQIEYAIPTGKDFKELEKKKALKNPNKA